MMQIDKKSPYWNAAVQYGADLVRRYALVAIMHAEGFLLDDEMIKQWIDSMPVVKNPGPQHVICSVEMWQAIQRSREYVRSY